MIIRATNLLQQIINKVIDTKRSNIMMISISIRNKRDANYKLDTAIVTSLSINQDSITNVMDKIVITIDITIEQFREIIKFQQDLYVDIIFRISNATSPTPIRSEKPIIHRFNALIHDLTNIAKSVGINALVNQNSQDQTVNNANLSHIDIQLDLIKESAYNLNKSSYHGITKATTLEEFIKYICSLMKVPNLNLVKPENTAKYQHIVIPTKYCGFRQIFNYLQKSPTLGVYAKGLSYYFTNETLYIFPPFDLKNKRTPRLTVIKAPINSYQGLSNYHTVDEKGNVTIVITSASHSRNLSTIGSENQGDQLLFTRADGMLDGQIDTTGKKMQIRNLTASISNKLSSSIKTNASIPKIIHKPTGNVYHHASSINEYQSELTGFVWERCRPFLIYPGMSVDFIFEESNQLVMKRGLVEMIRYGFSKPNRLVFQANASIYTRLTTDTEKYKSS